MVDGELCLWWVRSSLRRSQKLHSADDTLIYAADDEIEYEDQDDGLPDDEDTQTSDL